MWQWRQWRQDTGLNGLHSPGRKYFFIITLGLTKLSVEFCTLCKCCLELYSFKRIFLFDLATKNYYFLMVLGFLKKENNENITSKDKYNRIIYPK